MLGDLTSFPAIVPEHASHTFLPTSDVPPYASANSSIQADKTLEGGYLQLSHDAELPVLGSAGESGQTFTLCVYNYPLQLTFRQCLRVFVKT